MKTESFFDLIRIKHSAGYTKEKVQFDLLPLANV